MTKLKVFTQGQHELVCSIDNGINLRERYGQIKEKGISFAYSCIRNKMPEINERIIKLDQDHKTI